MEEEDFEHSAEDCISQIHQTQVRNKEVMQVVTNVTLHGH